MSKNRYQYTFPEKNIFRAMEVTEPEFDIFAEGREHLYVPLQPLRSPQQFTRIKKSLGIIGDKVVSQPNDYLKILFSGHRGCGKTVELIRFHKEIDTPKQYFSIFISLQNEIEITLMQPEDLYFIIISKLLRTLKERGVEFDEEEFEELAKEWKQDTDIEKEISHKLGGDASAEVKAGWSFWSFFSAEGTVKGSYGYENKTTQKIRETLRRNPSELVNRLNVALVGVRQAIEDAGMGTDLLFIIDDFEKTRPEIYNSVFINDPQFIQTLRAHVICCIPIQTFYKVQELASATEIFSTSYLPMIKLNEPKATDTFCDIVLKRADRELFDPKALEYLVTMSGGSPRQFLRLANQCFLDAEEKVSLSIAAAVCNRLAVEKLRPLSGAHRKILTERNFDDVSPELLELLFALNVLEYNGDDIVRKINPLLEKHFPDPQT